METNPAPLYISLEFTPNPNTLKYAVNREFLPSGAIQFSSRAKAHGQSKLAEQLFDVSGVSAVMIGKDFVTVTKTEDGDWDLVHQGSTKAIERVLGTEGVTAVEPGALAEFSAASNSSDMSELSQKIQAILDRDIRPAVAMDGGDITFDRFEDGVVFLHLKGSCAGCPSSTMTLKQGIETRLRSLLPEVREVVSV